MQGRSHDVLVSSFVRTESNSVPPLTIVQHWCFVTRKSRLGWYRASLKASQHSTSLKNINVLLLFYRISCHWYTSCYYHFSWPHLHIYIYIHTHIYILRWDVFMCRYSTITWPSCGLTKSTMSFLALIEKEKTIVSPPTLLPFFKNRYCNN